MKKSEISIARRRELVQLAVDNKDKAAEQLRKYARRMAESKCTTDRVALLSELLCVSEATIYREMKI